MNIGMLWYDKTKDSLVEKVTRAACYYTDKYGIIPDVCCVHPEMLTSEMQASETVIKIDDIEIRPSKFMLRNHIWIGREGDKNIDQGL